MIKVFLLLRRRPELSREEFLERWGVRHMQLVHRTASAMRIRRYVQNHPLTHPLGETLRASRGARAADYDGMAEVWWESFDALAEVGNTAGEIAATLFADEQSFLDLPRCEMWFATEHVFEPPLADDQNQPQ
ncbi:MAG: EthD domain-containing protein [Steroidobacteraceae bacterium]